MPKIFFKIVVVLFFLQTGVVMGLSYAQQYTNAFDTPCAKSYAKLIEDEKRNNKVDFFTEWKKYEKICSKTGEYQIYLANKLAKTGKHQEAQVMLKKIILEKGKKYDLRSAFGVLMQSLLNQNKLDEAKEAAMQCMIIYPYWYRGYLAYGIALVYQNKFEEGKQYIDKSISVQDSYSEPYAILTIIYDLHYDDAKTAVKMYKKGLSKKQEEVLLGIPRATLSIVECAMNQKDYKTAVWVLEKEKELYPDFAKTKWYIDLSNRVNAYFKQNNITEVFTAEEKEALKSDKVELLEILGK